VNDRTAVATAYNRVAPWYDSWEWQTFWDRNEVPLVRAEVSRMGYAERAIDLGMGTGRYVATLRAAGVDTFGIDVSQEMVAIAARKLKGRDRLLVGDLRSAPLAAESFQLAIAARVFCHVEDLIGAFRAASNLVLPDGALIVTELDIDHEFERTRIPTPAGKLEIETWKRSSGVLIRSAESAGWRFDRMLQMTAADCAWLPEDAKLSSIDRASDRVIFNVLSFRRG
jgi:SAM-dependent methyltransferase